MLSFFDKRPKEKGLGCCGSGIYRDGFGWLQQRAAGTTGNVG